MRSPIRAALLVAVAATTLSSTQAAAVPPAAGARALLTLSPSVGSPTTSITVTGTGFRSGELVLLTFDRRVLGSVNSTGRTGMIDARLATPADATPGKHLIGAQGAASGRTLSADFVVRTDW